MKKTVQILLVEDDRDFSESLSLILKRKGYSVLLAASAMPALKLLETERIDAVLSDVVMPKMNGLDFVKEIKRRYGDGIPVIMLSGYGNVKEAVEAMRLGAYNYFLKPVNQDELCIAIDKAVELAELKNENKFLRGELQSAKGGMLLSNNQYMQKLLEEAKTLAQTDINILITGESGTGKEVLARFIHDCSKRHEKSFMAINCQAYVETLIESELFGYRGGAFTGAANKGKPGKLEVIQDGTLFLDEIGELNLATQIKLLRVLENKEIEPVGGIKPVAVSFRLLTATNRDLSEAIIQKTFREDLFYRINAVTLKLPALRERQEDIIPLARHFLQVFRLEQKRSSLRFTPAAETALMNYHWPGNIRELRNVVEGAVALSKGTKIDSHNLRIGFHEQQPIYCHGLTFVKAKEKFEREFFHYWYLQHHGNISLIARTIGMDRKQVYKKLSQYQIADDKPEPGRE